jgi:hypothetical protein
MARGADRFVGKKAEAERCDLSPDIGPGLRHGISKPLTARGLFDFRPPNDGDRHSLDANRR